MAPKLPGVQWIYAACDWVWGDVLRLGDEFSVEAKLIDVKKMEKNHDLREDPFLHPGDMLFVPKNTMSKIDRFIPNMSMGAYLPLTIP